MEESTMPPNVSRQNLVVNDEANNSSITREVNKNHRPAAEERIVTKKEWITVAILCFVNLINYMDRTTIAGINKFF